MNSFPLKHNDASYSQDARLYKGISSEKRLIKLTTIPQVLSSLELYANDLPALTWYGSNDERLHLNYEILLSEIRKVAHWLRMHHRIVCGDRVIVISSNCPEVYVLQIALMSLGAITVPVNNNESPMVFEKIVDKVNPKKILTGRDVESNLNSVISSKDNIPTIPFAYGEPTNDHKWDDSGVNADDPAVILFTSGTTSAPKGVCLSHYNLLVNAEGLGQVHNHSVNNVHMCIMPLFHANAFGFSLIGSLYAKNHVVLCSGLPGITFWKILKDNFINIVSLSPEIIRVLTEIHMPGEDFPSLRYVVSAAAPLPKKLATDFIKKTGIKIHQGYGLSECVNFAATVPWNISEKVFEDILNKWQVPSIGASLFGCTLDVLNKDGVQAANEEEGEIVVTGHTIMLGYWGDDEETSLALKGGMLHTGDLGFFSEINGEKYFFVTGRKKEIIIRYGENISPLTIEAELYKLRKIGFFAITGFFNESSGEEIGLYILANYTSENLNFTRHIIKSCTSRYKPRVVIFGKEKIPATPTGKIKRSILAERFKDFSKKSFGSDPVFIKE